MPSRPPRTHRPSTDPNKEKTVKTETKLQEKK